MSNTRLAIMGDRSHIGPARAYPFFLIHLITVLFFLSDAQAFGQSREDINARIDSLVVGHGGFFSSAGESFVPDERFVREAQERYISQLLIDTEKEKYETEVFSAKIIRKLINSSIHDDILANALFIDWFVDQDKFGRLSRLAVRNNALRAHYVANVRDIQPSDADIDHSRGISRSILSKLHAEGLSYIFPTSRTELYMDSCRDNGVPVPNKLFSSVWQNLGSYSPKVSNVTGTPRLWAHYGDEPSGACVAVTFTSESNVHVDMICLGVNSGKSCFFETDEQGEVGEISTSDMNSAADPDKMQGMCSDCHAGENPFIIHPDKPAFGMLDRSKTMPENWQTPLVVSAWPTPGPTNILDSINSSGRCTECHVQGYAGRFPEISSELPGYCAILEILATPGPKRTMPASGGSFSDPLFYDKHIDTLLSLCGIPKGTTPEIVDIELPDDESFVSPPSVFGPIYACREEEEDTGISGVIAAGETVDGVPADSSSNARKIAVYGGVLGATVRLSVNGEERAVQLDVRNPGLIEFLVELKIDDVVTATQEWGGAKSLPSQPVTVTDVMVDYADGLPAPRIRPTKIYECANLIQVGHVPGVRVSVSVNGANPFSVLTATGNTIFPPGKAPFEVDDVFVAEASMCQLTSPPSVSVLAQSAPADITVPIVSPPLPFAGQELMNFENLTHGARTRMDLSGDSTEIGFDWPLDKRRNFDIAKTIGRTLSASDNWTLEHTLCGKTTTTEPLRGEVVCSDLSAPAIEIPVADMTSVLLIDAVPGARVRIYDSSNEEIGDSSGDIINLSRPLVSSEVITAIQQVGDCISHQGYQVTVR